MKRTVRWLVLGLSLSLIAMACGGGSTTATDDDDGCIASGTESDINSALNDPNDHAVLCANAVFELSAPVVLGQFGQQLYTQGFPTGDTRATLRIVSAAEEVAIRIEGASDTQVRNVIVDGNRPGLGRMPFGSALIEAGGLATGQRIEQVRAHDPRGWTILHLFEGPAPRCSDALVQDNVFGPAGHGADGEWADGISMACRNSVIRDNTIVDTTDGGIVVFGGPGSVIENNVIRAETRVALGGINMVDYYPYSGDYTGTIVRNNVIDAASAVIRIGLGMGWRVWTCVDESQDYTLYGATVTGNVLRGEWMQYGFAVDDVRDWTVTGNVDEATHSGEPSVDCRGTVASPPAGFQYHAARSQGTFQPEFENADLELALWAVPEPAPVAPGAAGTASGP